MELFKKIELEILKDLNSSFELSFFDIGKVHFGGEIIVCIVKFKDDTILKSQWKEFNSYLTVKFIPTVKDEYSKWNFYVFYFSSNKINKPLKYEIENNKFSSRKIVIEQYETITNEVIEKVVSEHITNENILINVDSKQSSTFKKNPFLAKIIDKLNLNKKNEDDLQKALDTIEKNYTDEI